MLTAAGFVDVRVEEKPQSRSYISQWMPGAGAEDYVVSADVTARKPGEGEACCTFKPATAPPAGSSGGG